MSETQQQVRQLGSFDALEREQALASLVTAVPHRPGKEEQDVNMHMHSFYSYNAMGYSPSRLAWEVRNSALYAAGLCDFDVLDGLEEFLRAGQAVDLRTAVHLETRAFVSEYADADISSPGEPGVIYIMGAGFGRMPAAGTREMSTLLEYRHAAKLRNIALVQRINPHVPEIAIDYETDVLPLTPSGNATERHIVSAYVTKAVAAFEATDERLAFWSRILDRTKADVAGLLERRTALEEVVRSRFAKRGGLGYEQPSRDTFPDVGEFIDWVRACGAIPMVTWLDGTSRGEQDPMALLASMRAKGATALNIIPDRNWNISDANERAIKTGNLRDVVAAARELDWPINVGTEMNKRGLPFVDDLAADALRPFRDTFLQGARIMVGQTLLARYADFPYAGSQARAEFSTVKAKNAFFSAVGALPPLTVAQAVELEGLGPDKALSWFRDRAR